MRDDETILCACGNVFKDLYDYNPSKGNLIRNQDYDSFQRYLAEKLADFVDAVKTGKRDQWIKKHLPELPNTAEVDDVTIINLFIDFQQLKCGLRVFECPSCGRILIEHNPDTNTFEVYSPDTLESQAILKSPYYPGNKV